MKRLSRDKRYGAAVLAVLIGTLAWSGTAIAQSCPSGTYLCADESGCCPSGTICGTGSNGCGSDKCCDSGSGGGSNGCGSGKESCGSGCMPAGQVCCGTGYCPAGTSCAPGGQCSSGSGSGGSGTGGGSGGGSTPPSGYTCSGVVDNGCQLQFCANVDTCGAYYEVFGQRFTCSSCSSLEGCASAAASACSAANSSSGGSDDTSGGCSISNTLQRSQPGGWSLLMLVAMGAVGIRRRSCRSQATR